MVEYYYSTYFSLLGSIFSSPYFPYMVTYIEITSWLVSAYDFYSRVVKDR